MGAGQLTAAGREGGSSPGRRSPRPGGRRAGLFRAAVW